MLFFISFLNIEIVHAIKFESCSQFQIMLTL